MSSTSSQALAASASGLNEPACEPSRSVKSSPTAAPSCESTGRTSPAMTTCEASPPSGWQQTEFPWMSSAAASLAKILAMPASALGLTRADPVSGVSLPDWLARFDPATSSWRTRQPSLSAEWGECSPTWPVTGLMRNGTCWALAKLERRSTGSVSGYWHTPTTRDYKGQSGLGNRTRRSRNGKPHIANLCDQLVDYGRQDLVRSPTFREWLMGLPIGWTALEASATPSSRKSRKSSGGPS